MKKFEWNSQNSVANRQPIPINVNKDERFYGLKAGINKGRLNAPIDPIGITFGNDVYATSNISMGSGALSSSDTGTFTVTYTQIVNTIVNPGPNDPTGRPKVVTLNGVSNLTAAWSGDNLVLQFDLDPSYGNNAYINEIGIHAISSSAAGSLQGYSQVGWFKIDKSLTHHTHTLTKSQNSQMMGGFVVDFASICVYTIDSLGINFGADVCLATTPVYVLDLNPPTITVTAANNGYVVAVTNTAELAKSSFTAIDIVEVESSASSDPGTGYKRVYLDTINPAVIISPNLNSRWVKARFSSGAGIYTVYSVAQKVTPISPVNVDLTPPNEVTAVTASWSGDNIVINYTLPSTDAGVRFLVSLTSPNSLIGSFYFYPDGTNNLSQTTTITKNDLFNQFGNHYSTYSGVFKSIDGADNRSAGVSFNTGTRANPLLTVTPTFSAVAISNGYTISYTLPAAATYAEVYQKYTSWSGFTNSTVLDTFSGTRSALGTSGTNTVTITGVVDNNGNVVAPLIGYVVSGTGVPLNTFISAVSGTGPYTITLSKYDSLHAVVASNFTTNATGLYSGQALVYSGVGPATLPSIIYEPTYIIIKYYDDFNNKSLLSAQQSVTPINPAVVDNTVPLSPTINTISVTSNTATINIVTTDVTTKGYKLRYKKNTDSLYTTVDVSPPAAFVTGTSTTPFTIGNLLPSTLYDISATGYNQYNGVGSYSTNSAATTNAQSVSAPTGLTLTNEIYGINAKWSAPTSPPNPTAYYKVELYNNAAPTAVILTDNTYSLSYDFINLTSGVTYFVKVFTVDTYGGVSSALTSSTLVVAPLTSTQAGNILTNQFFGIGGTSGTYNIALDGTGNGTTTPYKLYSGTGTYGATATGFYLDSTGKFSLKDKLTFDGTTLAVNGAITAQSGDFAGAMTIANGTMKIGTAAGGAGNNGIYISAGNYWYSSGNLAIGNAITWNGTALNVNGSISTNALSITGPTLIGGSGYLLAATSYSITNVSGNGTTITYTATNSLVVGQAVTIVGINPSVYNLTNATVAGANGTQFTVTNAAIGTYVSGGTVMVTGGTTNAARIQLASTALTAYDANGNATTQIVSNAANGANTFITTRAKIADWTITDSKIESTLVSGITKYTGLSASNTAYSLWAGATTAGNTDNTAPFSVTPLGAVKASNIQISGGTLDVGAASPNGFHVTSAGVLTATGATINGAITAISGSFTGNVQIGSSGSLYSGTVTAGTPPTLSGAGFILNSSGLRFNSATTNGITTIDGSTGQLITTSASIGTWNIDANTINKTTSNGKITLDSGTTSTHLAIYATNSDGNYTAGILAAKTATSGAANDIALWAGNVTGPANASSANFRVLHSGDAYVKKLNATGTITSEGGVGQKITIDGLHDVISFGTTGNPAQLFSRTVNGGTATFLTNGAVLNASYALDQTVLDANPYIAIGPSTNNFGKIMSGVGLYTTNAYLNVTQSNGIGMSTVGTPVSGVYPVQQILMSSGQVKLNSGTTTIVSGVETGTKISSQMLLDSKTITMQTWNTDDVATPTAGSKIVLSQGSVSIGARDGSTTGKITVGGNYILSQTSATNFIAVGNVSSLGIVSTGIGTTTSTVVLQASTARVNGVGTVSGDEFGSSTSAYDGPSRIILDATYGVGIWGLPVQKDIIIAKGTTLSVIDGKAHYRDQYPLGAYSRQRMLVEDPVSGQVLLGMAVYYASTAEQTAAGWTAPSASTGYIGDLFVVY